MTLKEFSDACHATNNYSDEAIKGGVLFNGMAEEAGEANGQFKRMWRDDNGAWYQDRTKKAVLECLDCMWYCVENIRALGYDIDDAAEMLISKLARRKAEGKINGEGSDR